LLRSQSGLVPSVEIQHALAKESFLRRRCWIARQICQLIGVESQVV
jgi:hypothetical protein